MKDVKPCSCGKQQRLQTALSIGNPKNGDQDVWKAYRCECGEGALICTSVFTGNK